MGLSTHGGLLQISCNLFFGENVRGSPLYMQYSFTMPKNNEFANKVNNSSHVSTLAHDTGKESQLESMCQEVLVLMQEVKREIQLTHSLNDAIDRCEKAAQKTLELSRQQRKEVEFWVYGLRIEKGGNNDGK